MTAKNRSTLAALFQNGDTPQGSDYSDVFDSFVSLTDTSAQTVTSRLVLSGGIETPTVSATRVNSPAVSADSVSTQAVSANRLKIFGAVSAVSGLLSIDISTDANLQINVPTTVQASAGVSGIATPASVAGFLPIVINGVKKLIPFYEP